MLFPNHSNSSGEFPVNFRTGKAAEFPVSGVPYIGTGNGKPFRITEGNSEMIVNLPNVVDLQSHLDRLEADLGRVILLAIKQPEVCNFAHCTGAGLNREERKTLNIALENAPEAGAKRKPKCFWHGDQLTAQKCAAKYCSWKAAL